jgi:uncharacterized protein
MYIFKLLFLLILLFGKTTTISSAENKFFRIGSGGVGGTYYPIAGLIANSISSPPGSRPCEKGGSCGVKNLIAIAQSSNGSVANINAINSGKLEGGLVQSDVVYWAYTGTGLFKDKKPVSKLRVIANLYPESVHLVTLKKLKIKNVRDLINKTVSIDEPGSGTLVDSLLILKFFNIELKDIKPRYLKGNPAANKIKDGQIDAFFSVTGYPKSAILDAFTSGRVTLTPINGPEIDRLLSTYNFFAKDVIPKHVYGTEEDIETISVNAQFITSTDVDDTTVYEITKALWNDQTKNVFKNGHAKAKMITLETALNGVGIPLHPGAKKFYQEIGLIK